MKFWDTSALIPLLANEPSRERLLEQLEQDPQVLIGSGTTVEVACALARREREKLLTADQVANALGLVRQLADSWHEIVPSDAVRRTAERLLHLHALRAADSLACRCPDCRRPRPSQSGDPLPGPAVEQRRSTRGIHGARGLTRQRQRVPDRRSVCGLKGAPASAEMLACCG